MNDVRAYVRSQRTSIVIGSDTSEGVHTQSSHDQPMPPRPGYDDPVTFPPIRRSLLVAIVIAFSANALGCDDDYCTKVCKRVAFCKEEATKSPERVLGEREPPANKRCLERCRADNDKFDNCEAVQRTCPALRDCLGSNFDN